MKQLLLNFLIFCLLWNGTPLNELSKLPVLAVHFMEHYQRDPKITVMAFLSMHYWGKDLNDNDGVMDMKLPFKKIDRGHQHTFIRQEITGFNFAIRDYKSANKIFLPILFITTGQFNRLYRPPQLS